MKRNNYLLAFIMLFLIGICSIPTNSYAAICDSIGHNYSSATCTSLATCNRCGGTKGGYASHSYGSYRTSTDATCTNDGSKVRYCSVCGDDDWGTIPAKGHTGGSLNDNKNASQHWRTCTRCGGGYDHQSHSGGTWYPDGPSHYKDCSTCGYKKYTSGAHDNAKKVPITGDVDLHDTFCQTCWNAGYRTKGGDEYQGTENHPSWVNGETSYHSCSTCKFVIDSNTGRKDRMPNHNYGGLDSGYVTKPRYSCSTCGNTISINNGTYAELHLDGLPEYEYVASDASIKMKPIPQFPHGTYTLEWKSADVNPPTLWNEAGKVVTPQINPADVAIYAWSRKNLKTHATKTKDYAKKAFEAQMELYGYATYGNEAIGDSEEDLYKTFDMIDHDINRASSHEKLEWNGVLHEACKNVYRDGGTYEPTITQASTTVYNLEFNHPTGGWLIPPNMFNSAVSLNDSLFQYGGGGGRRRCCP